MCPQKFYKTFGGILIENTFTKRSNKSKAKEKVVNRSGIFESVETESNLFDFRRGDALIYLGILL